MIIRPSDIDTFSESPRRWFFEYSRLVARVGGGRELAKFALRSVPVRFGGVVIGVEFQFKQTSGYDYTEDELREMSK